MRRPVTPPPSLKAPSSTRASYGGDDLKKHESLARNVSASMLKKRESLARNVSASTTSSAVDYYDGLVTTSATSPTKRQSKALSSRTALTKDGKLLLVLVGLPGRGKSYISAKLYSFLSWQGYKTRVFNVGQHRRKSAEDSHSRASFFDASNRGAKQLREKLAMEVLDAAIEWLSGDGDDDEQGGGGGDVALFDATNSTKARREAIARRCPHSIVYLESICDDKDVLEANMITKVSASPDFKGLTIDQALEDLKERIRNYERAYETVEDAEGAFVKLFNFSSKVTANNCFGRMSKIVVPFLMAVHANDRPIYLTALAPRKREPEGPKDADDDHAALDIADFEARLSRWWWAAGGGQKNNKHLTGSEEEAPPPPPAESAASSSESSSSESSFFSHGGRLSVFTSTMPLAIDAGAAVAKPDPGLVTVKQSSALNPLLLGESPPRDVKDRGDGGESYLDLVHRLESVVLDLEASVDPVLLVTHATPARVLRAYFKNIAVDHVIGEASSLETKALADAAPAVLELKPKVGGGFAESVHWL